MTTPAPPPPNRPAPPPPSPYGAPPPPAWHTEPARIVPAGSRGGWRRGVTVLGIVVAGLAVLIAAALLVGALRQLVGTTLHPTSAALPAGVSTLTVTANHGDLVLTEGPDLVVRTTGPGASFNEGRIEVRDLGDGAVEVDITQPNRWIGFPVGPNRASTYEIVVPADALDSANLTTELGDITTGYDVPTLQLTTELGDIEAQHITGADLLSAHSSLGDVRLTSSSADRIDASAELGDVNIDLPGASSIPSQVTAFSDLGDVAVVLPAAPPGHWYRVEARTDLGDAYDGTRTRAPVAGGTETIVIVEAATGSVRVTEQ